MCVLPIEQENDNAKFMLPSSYQEKILLSFVHFKESYLAENVQKFKN